jgi:formylglycine-generating enzyme required for sulfatase activity
VDLARTPLFLTWILQSYRASGGRLPGNRSRLLKGLLDTLIRREKENSDYETLSEDDIQSVFAELAFILNEENSNGAIRWPSSEDLIRTQLTKRRSVGNVAAAISLGLDLSLLKKTKGELRFCDQQFKEYYAGVALCDRFNNGEDLRRYFTRSREATEMAMRTPALTQPLLRPPPSFWEDALLFAAGLVDDFPNFLQQLSDANPRVAGECLWRNRLNAGSSATENIQSRLLAGATDSSIPLAERVALATTLGRVGDPRFKVENSASGKSYIPPQLVLVPNGQVRLGSDNADPTAFEDEKPQCLVTVPRFEIGRFCVTNTEYQHFVDGGGYKHKEYWTEAGWKWRNTPDTGEGSVSRLLRNLRHFRTNVADLERWLAEVDAPQSRRDLFRRLVAMDESAAARILIDNGYGTTRSKDRPAFDQEYRFCESNQPVVGVTWHEATAYCRWLSDTIGLPFALPTEVQWERAAKGDHGWVYPWGSDWAQDHCNGLSERLLQPSPVGVFPRGQSPFGCDDMAGNVFEWTRSIYRSYPYVPSDGREASDGSDVRVNRGGGWNSVRRVTRCAIRGDMCEPECYDEDLGFRVTVLK